MKQKKQMQTVKDALYKESREQRKRRIEKQGGVRANRPAVFDDKKRKKMDEYYEQEIDRY